jgi:hypothetical protein
MGIILLSLFERLFSLENYTLIHIYRSDLTLSKQRNITITRDASNFQKRKDITTGAAF